MIKVLHFVQTISRGGSERQLINIINNCPNLEHEVVSIKSAKNSYISDIQKIHFLKSKTFGSRVLEMFKLVKNIRPDIVYAWGPITYLIALLCSIPGRYKVINGSIRHGIFNSNFSAHFRRALLHCSRYIVANSIAGLKANGIKRGILLYNGVDTFSNSFEHKLDYYCSDLDKKRIVLSSIANLVPIKDYKTIFRSLEVIKEQGIEFIYFIMGDGPLRSEYQELVEKLCLTDRVVFLGNITNPETYLEITDIFLHSSRGEGCSNALLEAMFFGLPIIATDTGGTPEVLDDNAIMFSYGDYVSLSNAIKYLIGNPQLRCFMGRRSLEIAKSKFTLDIMISNYVKIIEAIYYNDMGNLTTLLYDRKNARHCKQDNSGT